MKYLQLFENFKPIEDWQVGDIVVGTRMKYCDSGNWIRPDEKYEIVGHPVWHRDIEMKPWNVDKTRISIKNVKDNMVYNDYWETNLFMTEEEWELTQKRDKFNL